MAFAVPKDYPRTRSQSPTRPKSAGASPSPNKHIVRPRSPTWKAPTPKQNIRNDQVQFGSGNVGNAVVMRIFEKLHESTGGGTRKRSGKSARSNLSKLGTAPSEKILRNQMWKDFFGNSANNSKNNSYVSAEKHHDSLHNTQHNSDKRSQTHGKDKIHGNEHTQPNKTNKHIDDNDGDCDGDKELDYQKLYSKLVKRINQLWKELKIPISDRDFYAVAIIKERYRTVNQIDDLSCYVKRLLDHRRDVIRVMKAIKTRESLLDQLNSLLSVALRYFNAKYSTLHDDIARKIEEVEEGVDKEQELNEAIKKCILTLQQVSCDVIRGVITWRDGLWRPQPFIYKDQNYLVKMQTDLNFLRSKSVERILAATTLQPRDLVCVLFKEEVMDGENTRTENGMVLHLSADDSPLRGGELDASLSMEDPTTDKTTEDNEEQPNGGVPAPKLHPPAPSSKDINMTNYEHTRHDAQHDIQEDGFLEDMVVIVTNERNVQRALDIETAALRGRGTFIPSLRFELDDESDANLLKNKNNM
mmetsp:Transcript_10094/g.18856  ORF Transcript_10094/g.18856 Transcript_10094/m.18856 type:complete len:528 (-) Transcript_10094:124-1707(-)